MTESKNPQLEYVRRLEREVLQLRHAIRATIGWQQSVDPENVESVRMLLDLPEPEIDWQQRSEAAEAKLAELNKQKPVGTVSISMDWNTHRNIATVNMRPDLVVAEMKDGDELFTRPVPAINLAELVPEEVTASDAECSLTMSEAESWAAGVNWVIGTILHNIEGGKRE